MIGARLFGLGFIRLELLSNPACRTGMVAKKVWYADGPWGGPEALCILRFESEARTRCWYGHVRPHGAAFASYVTMTSKLVSGSSAPDVLIAFFLHMTRLERAELPRANRLQSTYAEAASFHLGCRRLAKTIKDFSAGDYFEDESWPLDVDIDVTRLWMPRGARLQLGSPSSSDLAAQDFQLASAASGWRPDPTLFGDPRAAA